MRNKDRESNSGVLDRLGGYNEGRSEVSGGAEADVLVEATVASLTFRGLFAMALVLSFGACVMAKRRGIAAVAPLPGPMATE